jgi:hypothetical protein
VTLRLAASMTVALTAVVACTLGSVGPAAASGRSAPAAGYDCGPALSDNEAKDVMGATIAVAEANVEFPGPRHSYSCEWINGGEGTGKALVVSVQDLYVRANRTFRKNRICKGSGVTLDKYREQTCEAAAELEDVRSANAAFNLYIRLVRLFNGGANAERLPKLKTGGELAVLIDAKLGGAITMVQPGWTIVVVQCLNMKTSQQDRNCTLKAFKTVLANIRDRQEARCWDDGNGVCQPPFVQPVKKVKRR